ncbi:hypothetical protein OIO90_005932 [Microbotryomycetes sp. JL221]|nr:hypothetical protein OIO90_005932 [Microbotryomycetes sp. JL221]
MASFYGRRSSYYTASWQQPRLYPRQEPTFESGDTERTRTHVDRARAPSPVTTTTAPTANRAEAPAYDDDQSIHPSTAPPVSAPPRQPPPLYFPGEAQLARLRTRMGTIADEPLPPGTVPSTNVLTSATAQVEWLTHPTIKRGWRRAVRLDMWYAAIIRRQAEQLWPEWPREFGGQRATRDATMTDEATTTDDLEANGHSGRRRNTSTGPTTASVVSRMTSRRSGVSAVDSGVALTPRGTLDVQQHPLAPLYRQRMDELNQLIPQHLIVSRVYLALLEVANVAWLIALIVALAIDGGKQTGFLKGVEIALVLVILMNGIGVNAVRMRRWSLAKALRNRSRDWSPLPITTSTNLALLDNAGLNAGHHFLGETDPAVVADRVRAKDVATLRWRMRMTEGSWWLSYRPVIKVELVSPASSGMIAYAESPPAQHDASDSQGRAPAYEA